MKNFTFIKLGLLSLIFFISIVFSTKSTAGIVDTATANGVKARFSKMLMTNAHPRLFYSKADIANIKKLITEKDTFLTRSYDKIKSAADNSLSVALPV